MPFDAAKLAKLQAQAAQSRIGAYGVRRVHHYSRRHRRYYLLSTISPIIHYLNCVLTCPPFSSHLARLRRRFRYRQLNLLFYGLA